MGAALQHFYSKFNEFKNLPSGERFSIRVTETEATQAAKEYLEENTAQIKQLIKKATEMSLDVSDPVIRFLKDQVAVSARGGKSILKFNASLNAIVTWRDELKVNVHSVDIPVFKISPEKLNNVVKEPLSKGMDIVRNYADIISFKIMDGAAVLEAKKK